MRPFDSVRDLRRRQGVSGPLPHRDAQVHRARPPAGDHRCGRTRNCARLTNSRWRRSAPAPPVPGCESPGPGWPDPQPPMNASPAWFAIWTRSRHEQVVRDQIVTKGYEAFLPTIGKWSRWKDRKKQVDWLALPAATRSARFDPNDRLPIPKRTGVVSYCRLRQRAGADPRNGDRRHPPPGAERSPVRPMPVHPRRGNGRSHRRSAQGRVRPFDPQGRTRAADPGGRSDRPGSERGSRRSGRESWYSG